MARVLIAGESTGVEAFKSVVGAVGVVDRDVSERLACGPGRGAVRKELPRRGER